MKKGTPTFGERIQTLGRYYHPSPFLTIFVFTVGDGGSASVGERVIVFFALIQKKMKFLLQKSYMLKCKMSYLCHVVQESRRCRVSGPFGLIERNSFIFFVVCVVSGRDGCHVPFISGLSSSGPIVYVTVEKPTLPEPDSFVGFYVLDFLLFGLYLLDLSFDI